MKYQIFKTKKDVSEIVYLNCKNKIHVSVIGWEDGNYFIEFCKEEGGGVLPQIENFFKKLPVGKKMEKCQFEDLITFMDSYPYLKSNNGNIVYNYDLHIWCANSYFIFNFFKKEFLEKRLNFFEKSFGKGLVPKWQEQVL